MCGITGFQRRPGCAPGLDLSAAVRAIRHRGPDAQGERVEGDSGLGHTRLSIIDLSQAGAQPMASPDERYLIAFNGEIYNFAELRSDLEKKGERFNGHSDTEVLLRLFMVAGFEACLERLRGMFALAILDRAEDTLYVARDRLGVKPLVYAETGDAFLFGSEIASLFALDPGLSRAVDHQALDLYLSFQYIPSPHSGFKAVRKLEPAHALVVRGGRIQRHFRYWDVDLERRTTLSYAEAQEALREQVLEATRLRLVSDVPLGAFLSGGVDSSITVAAMARLTDQPVKTYSIGFDDPAFDETRYARQAAEFLATDHHEMQVTPRAAELLPRIVAHHGEPFADNSALPSYYVSEFARRSVTVALTGDGPDEVFGGYRRFTHALRMDRLDGLGLLP
ncbi:MAG: asparagine synthase (glutamine-hydrolyzing), partial [Gammaproteobacteria bacterium]